ncbi:MAG: hypothetical protein FJZ56_02570, partial [Chlamydiae bacterium]|nr:hypothetical protein [Chlamydiota bacterium]
MLSSTSSVSSGPSVDILGRIHEHVDHEHVDIVLTQNSDTHMTAEIGEPESIVGDDFVMHSMSANEAVIFLKEDKENEAEIKECFGKIKAKAFEKLGPPCAIKDFKLFIYNDRTGSYVYKNYLGNEVKGVIDFTEAPFKCDEIDLEYAKLDGTAFLRSNRGTQGGGAYRAGYMADPLSPSGLVMHPSTAKFMPKSMGEFCDKHMQRAMKPGANDEDYKQALSKMVAIDLYRKKIRKKVREEIATLNRDIGCLEGTAANAERIRAKNNDKAHLNAILANIENSDHFAANFVCCRDDLRAVSLGDHPDHEQAIIEASNLDRAARNHIEGTTDGGWFGMFGQKNLQLQPEDEKYCALLGSLALSNRANQYNPYCVKAIPTKGNTAIEYNLFLKNAEHIVNGTDETALNGLEMFDGLEDEKIKLRIQTAFEDADNDVNEVLRSINIQAIGRNTDFNAALNVFREDYAAGWNDLDLDEVDDSVLSMGSSSV